MKRRRKKQQVNNKHEGESEARYDNKLRDYITELEASRQEQKKKTEIEKKWVQEENYIHVEEKGEYIN